MFYNAKHKVFLVFFLFVITNVISQRLTNRNIEAKIDTSSLNGIYQIKSLAFNKTELYKTLKYDFSVIKKIKRQIIHLKTNKKDYFL